MKQPLSPWMQMPRRSLMSGSLSITLLLLSGLWKDQTLIFLCAILLPGFVTGYFFTGAVRGMLAWKRGLFIGSCTTLYAGLSAFILARPASVPDLAALEIASAAGVLLLLLLCHFLLAPLPHPRKAVLMCLGLCALTVLPAALAGNPVQSHENGFALPLLYALTIPLWQIALGWGLRLSIPRPAAG